MTIIAIVIVNKSELKIVVHVQRQTQNTSMGTSCLLLVSLLPSSAAKIISSSSVTMSMLSFFPFVVAKCNHWKKNIRNSNWTRPWQVGCWYLSLHSTHCIRPTTWWLLTTDDVWERRLHTWWHRNLSTHGLFVCGYVVASFGYYGRDWDYAWWWAATDEMTSVVINHRYIGSPGGFTIAVDDLTTVINMDYNSGHLSL